MLISIFNYKVFAHCSITPGRQVNGKRQAFLLIGTQVNCIYLCMPFHIQYRLKFDKTISMNRIIICFFSCQPTCVVAFYRHDLVLKLRKNFIRTVVSDCARLACMRMRVSVRDSVCLLCLNICCCCCSRVCYFLGQTQTLFLTQKSIQTNCF